MNSLHLHSGRWQNTWYILISKTMIDCFSCLIHLPHFFQPSFLMFFSGGPPIDFWSLLHHPPDLDFQEVLPLILRMQIMMGQSLPLWCYGEALCFWNHRSSLQTKKSSCAAPKMGVKASQFIGVNRQNQIRSACIWCHMNQMNDKANMLT